MNDDSATVNRVASIDAIRAHFPALERVQGVRPVAYFDGPGGTQVPRSVVDAMVDYLTHHNANTHWAFPSSRETDEILTDSRRAVADLLNASPDEIVFGANMTTLTFHLARGLGRGLGPGDEIVVSEIDHHANIAPWQALERERGITLRIVRMDPDAGRLDWTDLARTLNSRTKLLAIGAASNALGTINDTAEAARMAHAAGALVFVDAVHYAPHRLVDTRAIDCDFLACSAYKFYGPHVGVLFGKKALLESIEVPKLQPAPESVPERMETGTQNHEGIAGTRAAVDFLASLALAPTRRERLRLAFEAFHERGDAQVATLWEALSRIRRLRLYGPPPGSPRTPTVSFTLETMPAVEVARRLAGQGLFVSHGDFYAKTVVERLGCTEQGLVRIGCACYTTNEEIERLIDAIRGCAELG